MPAAAAPGLMPQTLAEEAAQLTAALEASLAGGQRAACGGNVTAFGHAAPGRSEPVCCAAGACSGAHPTARPATVHPAVSNMPESAACGALPAAEADIHRSAANALNARVQPGAAQPPTAHSAPRQAGALSSISAGAEGGTAAGSRAAAVAAPRRSAGPDPSRAPRQPLGALGALMAASRQQRASLPGAALCAPQGEYSRDTESALLARLCPAPRREALSTGAEGSGSAAGWQVPGQPGGLCAPAAGLLAPSGLAAARAAPGRMAGVDADAGAPLGAGSGGARGWDVGSEGPSRGSLWAAARDTRPQLPQAAGLEARVRKRKAAAAAAEAGVAGQKRAAAAAPGSQGAGPCSLKQVHPWRGCFMPLLQREM